MATRAIIGLPVSPVTVISRLWSVSGSKFLSSHFHVFRGLMWSSVRFKSHLALYAFYISVSSPRGGGGISLPPLPPSLPPSPPSPPSLPSLPSLQVCPHHLFLCDEDIPTIGTGKSEMRPVLCSHDDQQALWENMPIIDCFATDHGEPASVTWLSLLIKQVNKKFERKVLYCNAQGTSIFHNISVSQSCLLFFLCNLYISFQIS